MSQITYNTDNRRIEVSGKLTFDTVPNLSIVGLKFINEDQDLVFDLRPVTRSDSAALALIVSWMRAAKKQHKSICFINVPEQILHIAQACRLEHILPLVKT